MPGMSRRRKLRTAASIVLAGIGAWGLGMRAMMKTTLGEDYLRMAEASGLRPGTIFIKYAVRNALLPQVTSLAISLSLIVLAGSFGHTHVYCLLRKRSSTFRPRTVSRGAADSGKSSSSVVMTPVVITRRSGFGAW